MDAAVAQVAVSTAGHDRGKLYCVLDTQGDFLLLADGKRRRLIRPKKKRRSHARLLGTSDHPVFARLKAGTPVGDCELRKALAAFREGGNHAWQRTI